MLCVIFFNNLWLLNNWWVWSKWFWYNIKSGRRIWIRIISENNKNTCTIQTIPNRNITKKCNPIKINEPHHDKTNKITCVPSKDQPGKLPSLIRVFAVCMKQPYVLSYILSTQWRLIRLGRYPGWCESLLSTRHLLVCCVQAQIIKILGMCLYLQYRRRKTSRQKNPKNSNWQIHHKIFPERIKNYMHWIVEVIIRKHYHISVHLQFIFEQ